eukprot:5167126-Amphidinium_carterae.2
MPVRTSACLLKVPGWPSSNGLQVAVGVNLAGEGSMDTLSLRLICLSPTSFDAAFDLHAENVIDRLPKVDLSRWNPKVVAVAKTSGMLKRTIT